MWRIFISMRISLVVVFTICATLAAQAQATCTTVLQCAQQAVDIAARSQAELRALEIRLNAKMAELERTFGKARILATLEYKGGIVNATPGTRYDSTSGVVSFDNPRRLQFVPVVADISSTHSYMTTTHFIRSISPPDRFQVWGTSLDVTASNFAPIEFSVVVVGFER